MLDLRFMQSVALYYVDDFLRTCGIKEGRATRLEAGMSQLNFK
jgi:hypothetical protein